MATFVSISFHCTINTCARNGCKPRNVTMWSQKITVTFASNISPTLITTLTISKDLEWRNCVRMPCRPCFGPRRSWVSDASTEHRSIRSVSTMEAEILRQMIKVSQIRKVRNLGVILDGVHAIAAVLPLRASARKMRKWQQKVTYVQCWWKEILAMKRNPVLLRPRWSLWKKMYGWTHSTIWAMTKRQVMRTQWITTT